MALFVRENIIEELRSWEKRLEGESLKAFKAFSLYRSMGYHRSIKGAMELNGVSSRQYGSWSRWARIYDWKKRCEDYDTYIMKESEKSVLAYHIERKKHMMEMLDKLDVKTEEGLDRIKAEDLSAGDVIDLLERSAKLDGYISGSDVREDRNDGQLQISFVDAFKGI